MNTPQHLADLLLLPWNELRAYHQAVADLVTLRARIDPMPDPNETPAPVVVVSSPVPSSDELRPVVATGSGNVPPARGLRERSPLREPKPGSLRADIHRILEESGRPMRRADVIAQVATIRGVAVDTALKVKVGDHLTNRHDPYVRRLAQGIYQYVPATGGLACL